MTQQEKSIIVNEILNQLQTDARLIEDLEPVDKLKDTDLIEISGGRRVSIKELRGAGVDIQKLYDAFIRRDQPDRTPYMLSSDTGFEVGDFLAGVSGGRVAIDKETGHSYAELDRLYVRVRAYFESLTVIEREALAGEQQVTPGGGVKCTSVDEVRDANGNLTGWRCYFLSEQDGEKRETKIIAGDQAIAQTFNAKTGTSNKVSNKRWWRLVTAVSNDAYTDDAGNHYGYIEVSRSDCETGSGVPVAGDEIAQFGNRTDATRQAAIVISTVSSDAPSMKLFTGIGSGTTNAEHYSLSGRDIISYGYDHAKGRAYMRCYGDLWLGDKDGTSYVKYDSAAKKWLLHNVSLSVSSTIGDKTIEDYVKSIVPPVTQEDITQFVNNIVGPDLNAIKNQIDGVVETWWGEGAPTMGNYPANQWTTDAEKEKHLSDLYCDNETGFAYRFSKAPDGTYFWNDKVDTATAKALAEAAKAQDTADRKRRVFVAQPTTPYDMGDIWVNATYGTQYFNDILRCVTAKTSGQAFSISDWTLASKYTDDSALNTFISQYTQEIDGIKNQMDGKAETWHQATDPSAAWTTAAMKTEHKGDLWYCTADIANTNFKKGTTWYWGGAAWEKQDVPESVFDAIDGKADIFVSKPTTGYHKNDLWFLEADYTLSGVAYKVGTLVVAKNNMGAAWSADDWIKKDRYTDATDIANALKDYEYLTEALKDVTTIQGALMMTGLVRLGQYNSDITQQVVWAGINGVRTNDKSIAAWYGGDMLDKEYGGTGRTAKSLFRMDGSGYLADGNITWNAMGAIRFGSGIVIDLGGGNTDTLGGLSNTLANNINLLNNVLNCFEPQDSGNNPVGWDSPNIDRIKVKKNFYSMGFVSAKGMNPDGTIAPLVTSLGALTDVTLTGLAAGQALVYNGSEWVNQTIQAGGIDEAQLSQYLTDNAYAKQSWVSGNYQPKGNYALASSLSSYLPLTGGTLTGATYVRKDLGGNLSDWVNKQHNGPFEVGRASNTMCVAIGVTDDNYGYIQTKGNGITTPGNLVLLPGGGNLYYGSSLNTIYHSGNLTNLSQLANGPGYITSAALSGYVTTNTNQVISAQKTFNTETNTRPVVISRGSHTSEALHIGVTDAYLFFDYKQDEAIGRIRFTINCADTEGGGGANASSRYFELSNDYGVLTADLQGTLLAKGFRKENGTSSQFLKADGSVDSNSYALASSLGNYLPLSGGTLTGKTTFPYNTLVVNSDGGDTALRVFKSYGGGNANNHYINFGHDPSAGNCGEIIYHWDSATSANNYIGLGFYGGIYLKFTYGGALAVNNNTVWHSGTDGSGSGLDADLLDGVHASAFARSRPSDSNINMNNVASYGNAMGMQNLTGTDATVNPNGQTGWHHFINMSYHTESTNMWQTQFAIKAGTTGVWVRSRGGGSIANGTAWAAPWVRLARTTDNVASATRLQGTYSLWGQSFYGNNVSGNMTGVGNINTAAAPIGTIYANNWFRSTGATGWYNETYGGGWYMEDSDWLRAWNSKGIYTAGQIYSRSSVRIGDCTMVWDGANTINIQDKNLMGRNLGINDTSGVGVGISLYGGAGHVGDYGIMFATTANYGKHLNVYGDWATYFTMYGDNRGWIFKKANNNTNVASISAEGWFSCRKGLQICGPTTNNMAYNTDNPRVIFCEEDPNASDGIAQRVGIVYTDYDSYRRGKGLCVMDIDRDDPTVWFEVKGTIFATTGIESAGYITAKTANSSSDARLKDILGNILLDIDTMADAPSVRFKWKDTGEIAAGSIAQYWQPRLPEVVSTNNKGYYTLGYGVLGTLMGKSCAVHLRRHEHILLTHESRITRLERENREMRQEINELKRQLLNND